MSSLAVHAESFAGTHLKQVLSAPLIVGASVSDDYFVKSPGKILALRYTEASKIRVVAQNGKPGSFMLSQVTDEKLKDRSCIIGLDLFFWDSFAASPTASLKAMDKLVQQAKDKKIPLVLGEVPALMPSRQPSLVALNNQMKKICKEESLCRILPLNDILHQVVEDGHIIQGGKTYTLEQLLPDGLHIGLPASEYLADRIAELF